MAEYEDRSDSQDFKLVVMDECSEENWSFMVFKIESVDLP